jgi:hypothetical protein
MILLGEADGVKPRRFPYPDGERAVLEVTEASLYDLEGQKLDELPVSEYDAGGIKGAEVAFPDDAGGLVAVVTWYENVPGRYYLDDVLTFAGELPIWEQTVTVEVPDGMRVYWDGVGIGDPERVKNGRTERMTWTILNEPAHVGTGMAGSGRPMLSFSLEHGYLAALKKLKDLENVPYAPRIPQSVSMQKGSVFKTAGAIYRFMAARSIPQEDGTSKVRTIDMIPPDGPWTAWEQVLIAAKWMSALGFRTQVYWEQSMPSGTDGPASPKVWSGPVLKAADDAKKEVYYRAGYSGSPEKLPPSLYGQPLYRAGNSGIERITLPRGSASDHTFSQNWKVSLGEDGTVSGVLDMTLTGAWMDIFAVNTDDLSFADTAQEILSGMIFKVPGIILNTQSVKPLGSGCRVTMSVNAAPGIVSANSILFRLMGGIPRAFETIPAPGTKYAFRFPFVFEINSMITTPRGYKALDLPGRSVSGDSKAMLEQSVVHWTKRARTEASCRWTVRASDIDEYTSARISDQLALVAGWPDTSVPLRK